MNYQDHKKELEQKPEYQKALEEAKFQFAFGDAVIRARIKKGWSQTELARKAGTRQANISRIEAGLSNPTLKLIQKICSVLDIEMAFSTSAPCIQVIQKVSTKSEKKQLNISDFVIAVPDWPESKPITSTNSEVYSYWGNYD